MGTKCIHIKDDGKRCGPWAVKGEDYCRKHMKGEPSEHEGLLAPESEHVEKKEATKPWNADSNPWSLDLLRLQKKRPGFRCKFTNADHWPTKQQQGWKIANIKDYGGVTDVVVGEEGQMDTTIRRREMFLIEMPEEMAKERDKFFKHKTNAAMEAANRMAESGVASELKSFGHDAKVRPKFSTRQGGF